MKLLTLAAASLLCLLFSSCEEEPLIPEKSDFSDENYFDFGGDEIATCMTSSGDDNVLFVQREGGNYMLLNVDANGDENSRQEISSAYPGFEAESIYTGGTESYLVIGSLDGRPSWVIVKADGTGGFFPQTPDNDSGRLYAALKRDDHWLLCGQKDIDGNRQVFLSRIDYGGSLLDSVSFGTNAGDGGIHLLESQGRTLLLAYSYGKGLGDRDFWLMEIDDNLMPKNEKVYGGAGYDQPEWMIEAYGAIYVCGHTTSFGDPMHDAYLICLEKDLNLRWEKNFHTNGHEGADYLVDLGSGQLAFCSYGMMPVSGGYYGIADANGLVLDQRKFPEFERFFQLRAYPDRLMILNQKQNLTKDIGVWLKSY